MVHLSRRTAIVSLSQEGAAISDANARSSYGHAISVLYFQIGVQRSFKCCQHYLAGSSSMAASHT
jgi:hypothetical protein